MMMKKYFLYVRRYSILTNDYELYVYRVETDNVYRVIGKLFVSSMEHVKRIDFCRWSQPKEDYWNEQGIKIIDYVEPVLSEDEAK